MFKTFIIGGAILAVSTTSAFAHISLAPAQAPAGSTYRAVLQVPHGCEGAATTGLRVQIPEGLIAVKPQPKAGWTLQTVESPYAAGSDNHGTPATGGVKEVIWSGGDLPDAFYDEFLLRGTLSPELAAGTTIYFPVIQQCGNASEAWIEIPDKRQPEPELLAPSVTLTPATGAVH